MSVSNELAGRSRYPRLLVQAALLVVLATPGCNSAKFDADMELGGVHVTKEVLNRGLKTYRRYCASCHGLDGKGKRLKGAEKPSRDFTVGEFKYNSVPENGLPTDEDLLRTILRGVTGSQMQPYDSLPYEDLEAVVQYIKTFSPRWQRTSQGVAIPVTKDPWVGKSASAIERGRLVYHGGTMCWQCHPAYASDARIKQWALDYTKDVGSPPPKTLPFRAQMERSARVTTRFGKVLPPDFLFDRLPTARGSQGLYRAISAGVGGTDMPGWHGKLANQDLWAVVHYVRDLVRHRGTPQASVIRAQFGVGVRQFGVGVRQGSARK